MAHEELEERELLRGEAELGVAAPHPPRRGIEAEVVDPQLRRARHGAAARKRAQAREELRERERLREVVVGPGVETEDAVVDRVARREDQDGSRHLRRAQPPADLEPVEIGEHHVEHDRRVRGRRRHPERVGPGAGDVRGMPLLDEPAAEEPGQLRVVLDDEHPHGPNRGP